MLKTVFKDSHYAILSADSGKKALELLKESYRPDLFILDIDMPRMDGYELAVEIRAAGHKAPIIFLTANADEKYVLKAIKAGAADFIVKPINKERFLAKVAKRI
ncbi:MAG: response regulator [Helicobacteraceae bacterium]|jgi:two-component system OmpR family response regulator|nr:response regulator [Helicobacteraceae bacterium]